MTTTDTPVTEENQVNLFFEPAKEAEPTEQEENVEETLFAEDETDDEAAPETEGEPIGEEDDDAEEAEFDADEEDDDEPADTQEDSPIRLKVDGEEVEVSLQDLKNGYAGQASLNKRHTALKEQEQAVANAAQQMQQARDALLQLHQQQSQRGFVPQPLAPNPTMAQTDPIGYIEAKAKYDEDIQAWNVQEAQVQALQAQKANQEQLTRQQHIAAQQQELAQAFPSDFKDEPSKQAFQKRLMDGAKEHYGIQPEMFNGITDAFAVKVLNDALKFREIKAGKKAARKQPETPKGATRPRARSKGADAQKRERDIIARAKKSQDWREVFKTPNA